MDATTGTTSQALSSQVNTIQIRGLFAETFLNDPVSGFNGGCTASKDQVAGTSSLDFQYARADPSNPTQVTLITGSGSIPNSSFTVSTSSASLSVTTTFPIIQCLIDTSTGASTCDFRTTPSTFNLTWARNGFEVDIDHDTASQTIGPLTTRSHGSFARYSANVNGTWDGNTTQPSSQGFLQDTKQTIVTRDITVN